MKVLAVLCGLFGFAALSGVASAEDVGSSVVSLVLAVAFFVGAYKLWRKKRIPKNKNTSATSSEIVPKAISPYMETNDITEPINFDGVIVREEEKVYLAIPAETFINKTRVTGYQSESHGGTVRVAKGLSVGNRKRETRAVRENVNDIKGKGDYVVTNKRAIFVGLGDSFDIPLAKITSVSMVAENGFVILANGKAYNVTAGNPGSQYACDSTLELIRRFS